MLLKREDTGNLRIILQSELNARNKIAAVEALIIPELRQNYFIINWRLEEIQKVRTSNGKILIMNKMHHPEAGTNRLHVRRKEGLLAN
jgi:vacuolar-type H+-ATPase subunit D/Vma8